jgi:hypothetical protein
MGIRTGKAISGESAGYVGTMATLGGGSVATLGGDESSNVIRHGVAWKVGAAVIEEQRAKAGLGVEARCGVGMAAS